MKTAIGFILIILLTGFAFYIGKEYEKGNRQISYKTIHGLQRGIYHDLHYESIDENNEALKEKIEFLNREWREVKWSEPDTFLSNWNDLNESFYTQFNESQNKAGDDNSE